MISIKEQLAELDKQHKEMSKSKEPREITQEFIFRSKLRDVRNLCKEWDELAEQQSEIEGKLQELEASPPRLISSTIFQFKGDFLPRRLLQLL